ncbi:MAG TPA: hypothetical protein VMG09_02050, partial [Bacteroidota bacterium]|nr:hypothetical protein [Bacteroidota bacterium]
IVDVDGLHALTEKSGYCPLAQGLHQIEVQYFNKTGDAVLTLGVAKGAGWAKNIGKVWLRH